VSETTSILETAFDTPNEKGSTEPVPAGQYVASVFDAAVKARSGKGQGVNLQWEIEGGEYAGRRIFDLVIISHENPDTMRIGRGKFKDVAVACGITEAITDLKATTPVSIPTKIVSLASSPSARRSRGSQRRMATVSPTPTTKSPSEHGRGGRRYTNQTARRD